MSAPAEQTYGYLTLVTHGDMTGEAYETLLDRSLQSTNGEVLTVLTTRDSLIGEYTADLLVLARWPDGASPERWPLDPELKTIGDVLDFAIGGPTPIYRTSGHLEPFESSPNRRAAYLFGAFSLANGVTFRTCKDQMRTVLRVARMHHADVLGTIRVNRVISGRMPTALFGMLSWHDRQDFESFARTLLEPSWWERLVDRPAHGLQPGQALLLEAGRAP